MWYASLGRELWGWRYLPHLYRLNTWSPKGTVPSFKVKILEVNYIHLHVHSVDKVIHENYHNCIAFFVHTKSNGFRIKICGFQEDTLISHITLMIDFSVYCNVCKSCPVQSREFSFYLKTKQCWSFIFFLAAMQLWNFCAWIIICAFLYFHTKSASKQYQAIKIGCHFLAALKKYTLSSFDNIVNWWTCTNTNSIWNVD